MTYGSLFTGIGGLDLGLDRAGFECRWQVEIDPYATKVLERHWPNVKRYGDITKLTGDELEPVDALCGGFPCQDLSQAGKQAGIEGTRSGLWFEYARLIRELRPRYVLIENVSGLLVSSAMRRVIGELARLGYVGCWRSLRASEFGASHLRKRVFIVAYSEHARSPRAGAAAGRPTTSDHALRSGNGHVAYSPSGGRGELRQPSGSNGFANGRHAPMGHAQRTGLEVGDGKRELQFHGNASAFAPGLPAGLAHATDERHAGNTEAGRSGEEPSGELDRTEHSFSAMGMPFAPGPSDPRWPAILRERPDLAPAIESPLCRMADGISGDLDRAMSNRTKRLGRLGNAVVPQIAEWIGKRILEFEESYA